MQSYQAPPQGAGYPPPGTAYPPPPPGQQAYVAPLPTPYRTKNGVTYPQENHPVAMYIRTSGTGGFWRGCCAALCCCCLLEECSDFISCCSS